MGSKNAGKERVDGNVYIVSRPGRIMQVNIFDDEM